MSPELLILSVWLSAGIVLVALELVCVSTIGFVFAGFGALTTGAILHLGWIGAEETTLQFIVFLAATSLWTGALWLPVKRWHITRLHKKPSEMIGDTAYIGSAGLSRRADAEVTYAGSIRKARLSDRNIAERLEAGTEVIITEVIGDTLVVELKH